MFTHIYSQTLQTPEGSFNDAGTTYSGRAVQGVEEDVNANGGGANALAVAFGGGAAFKSMALLATVPCVVTLTGATVIDGVTIGTVTLVANVMRHVAAITGDVTAVSVGANTDSLGAAGTIRISVLFDS